MLGGVHTVELDNEVDIKNYEFSSKVYLLDIEKNSLDELE